MPANTHSVSLSAGSNLRAGCLLPSVSKVLIEPIKYSSVAVNLKSCGSQNNAKQDAHREQLDKWCMRT